MDATSTPPTQALLPGTVIPFRAGGSTEEASAILDGLFAGGGLVLSQISALCGVEAYSVQNWIKRGFCSPPTGKKYSRRQFCRLILLNLLKETLSLTEITSLLSYINGDLTDESDDLIADDDLYLLFIDTLQRTGVYHREKAEKASEAVSAVYREPAPGAAFRLQKTLVILTCAYYASLLHRETTSLLRECDSFPHFKHQATQNKTPI